MSGFKIAEARFRNGNEISTLSAENITQSTYQTTFRGKLLCPYPNCTARVSYVERHDSLRYFRTWRHDIHVEKCPYSVSYKEYIGRRRAFNPDYKYALSDSHVDSILRRAHNILKGRPPSRHPSKVNIKTSNSITVIDDNLEPAGIAALLGDTVTTTNGREPSVYIRDIDQLTQEDAIKNRIYCVVGRTNFMWLDTEYGYLNVIHTGIPKKIHFNEAFIATNETEYSYFHYLQRYIREHPNAFVFCIGMVVNTSTGLDVRPDRWNAISIDGKRLYSIVNDYHGT